MVMAAHRYCLGRKSYIVGVCVSWLKTHWGEFMDSTQDMILQDTIAAIMDGDAGSRCDEDAWKRFATDRMIELPKKRQLQLIRALDWKNKPWPL